MNRRHIFAATAAGTALIAAANAAKAQSAPSPAGGSTLDQIRKSGVVRMSAIIGQEPYFNQDLISRTWSGACIEMGNNIAKLLNAKPQWVECTWGNSVMSLESNKIDLAFAMNPTPARALAVAFTDPIFKQNFCIILRKGYTGPASKWSDLDKPGVKVSVGIGSTMDIAAQHYLSNAHIMGFTDTNEAVMAAATGRSDCTIETMVLALTAVKKNPQLGTLVVPQPELSLPVSMAVRYEPDERFRDFLSVWADYNRSIGQTRAWMLDGFKALGITAEDIPASVTF